jgi:Arm DNA-binding domain
MARDLIPGDVAIRSIKPGDPRGRLGDGDGLYLKLFVKGGSHGWRLDYTVDGARKTLSLGTYPDTSLALARKKADEARGLVSAGVDPSDMRKAAKADALRQREAKSLADAGLPALDSFEAVAREWLEQVHAATVSDGQLQRTQLRLEREVFPWLGRQPIASVKAPAVLECLRRVEARGALGTAHRVKQACGQVFRYGIATGRCERDPAADLRDALASVIVAHRPAITDPKRVGELLRAIDSYQGHAVTRTALQLAPLVFQRPGELRRAEWAVLAAGPCIRPLHYVDASLVAERCAAGRLRPCGLASSLQVAARRAGLGQSVTARRERPQAHRATTENPRCNSPQKPNPKCAAIAFCDCPTWRPPPAARRARSTC